MSGASFERLFSPRAVAVFGSVKASRIAHQICVQMTRGGYAGVLVSVNPGAEKPAGIEGVPAYADVGEAPGDIDLAVLAVPARYAAECLAACGKKGIPFAVVLTSGFSETGDRAAEETLRRTAAENRIRIIGPNCAGIMSTPARLFASIEERALPGRAALVSQSGAVGAAALAMAGERGIGFSRFVSIGNRADIDESDMLDFLALDDETAMAALYLESVADGRKFLRAASRFSERKPLIVIKAGRSGAGTRAASSHTGSMAGSDDVFAAACAQTGIIRVDGIEEMLDLCSGFEHYPVPRGERLLIVTNSGGPGILTSDRAEALGLRVEPPSPALRGRLKEKLLPNASAQNPVDLTVEGSPDDYAFALSACLAEEYDAAIAINVGTPFLDSTGLAEGAAAGARETAGKPVIPVFMAGRIVAEGVERLKAAGMPPLPTGERAAAVLRAMAPRKPGAGRPARDWALGGGEKNPPAGQFLEPEQAAFLTERVFPLPAHRFVSTSEEARKACADLRFPLVMKIVSPEIVHKSDKGGVILGIRDSAMCVTAFEEMTGRLSGYGIRGVMIYEQLSGGRECILGLTRDASFGPVVLAGAGGVMSELVRDVSMRIAPLSRDDCGEMIDELRFNRVISGFRGGPPLSRGSLVDLMMRLSELAVDEPWIEELDFNPVFLFPDRAVIGDVRILRKAPDR